MSNIKQPKAEPKTEPKAEMKKPAFTQSFYVGPSVKGVISTHSIFKNGIPVEIVEELKKKSGATDPVIKALFVPIENLSQALEDLKKVSKINTCYNEVVKALNKEVER